MIRIIVKPETLFYCANELESFLNDNGFFVSDKTQLSCWDEMSIQLYKKSKKVTERQLELQNIVRKQLFGDMSSRIEIWDINSQGGEPELIQYSKLNTLKKIFRSMKWIDGLTLRVEYKEESAVYHFTYFHVPDASDLSIEEELCVMEHYINEMDIV